MIDLRYRHIEFMTKPVLQSLHDVPLVFQRVRFVKPKLESQNSDRGHCYAISLLPSLFSSREILSSSTSKRFRVAASRFDSSASILRMRNVMPSENIENPRNNSVCMSRICSTRVCFSCSRP